MTRFVNADRRTRYLLPPSVEEWLPDEHLARFIVEVVDGLDLSALVNADGGRGSEAHLLGLLVYGDATGTFSSRKIEPALNRIAAQPEALGQAESLLADSGYFSQANVNACAGQGRAALIPPGRTAHHLPWQERFAPDAPAPPGGDPLTRMLWRLKTTAGRAAYAKRKSTVEPVFGIVKHVLGFRQFSLRGIKTLPENGGWSRWPGI